MIGTDHPHTIGLMQNLADLYSESARFDEAGPLYEEALDLSRQVRGDEHPDTARTGMNLANWYHSTGDLQAAEALHREMLDVRRRVLGNSHGETLNHMTRLAALYTDQKRYPEAEQLLRESFDGSVRVLGEEHPYTLDTVDELIRLLVARGSVADARPLTSRLLALRRQLAQGEAASLDDRNAYAWLMLTCEPGDLRSPEGALQLALEVNQRTGFSDIRYLKTLARAYHSVGDSRSAANTQRQAISLLPEGSGRLRHEYLDALQEFEAATKDPPFNGPVLQN